MSCLLHWLRGMHFDERHPGLPQIEGGIAIAARLRCARQRNEARRKFHVGRGGTAPRVPSYQHRPCLTPCPCPSKIARRQGNHGRRAALGCRSPDRFHHRVRAVDHRIFRNICAVRALGRAGWNHTQFACCTGHRAYPLSSLCVRGVCSHSSNNSSRGEILLPIPRSKAAPERGFALMWR